MKVGFVVVFRSRNLLNWKHFLLYRSIRLNFWWAGDRTAQYCDAGGESLRVWSGRVPGTGAPWDAEGGEARVGIERSGKKEGGISPPSHRSAFSGDIYQGCARPRLASRRALNSVPGRHSGHFSPLATCQPTISSSWRSSIAPARSQSGRTSSPTP